MVEDGTWDVKDRGWKGARIERAALGMGDGVGW